MDDYLDGFQEQPAMFWNGLKYTGYVCSPALLHIDWGDQLTAAEC